MQSSVFRRLACTMVAIALITASCSSKKEEAQDEEVRTASEGEEPATGLSPATSSPPPTGHWEAVDERSGDSPITCTVRFDAYSSAADVKAVAESASRGDCKARIESFDSHGGMQVGRRFMTQDGRTMVVGQFWVPQFVTARQVGDAWKITIVSGSPFVKEEEAKPQDVGFIELTVPVKGDGGTGRLYMATPVAWEKGLLVPKTPDSKAEVLTITSFVPSNEEAAKGEHEVSPPSGAEPREGTPGPAPIPDRFQGAWLEAKEGAKLVIRGDRVVWVKRMSEEMREEIHEAKTVSVSPDGRTLSFTSTQVYSRDVFFPKSEHSGPVTVTLDREDAALRVTIGEMRVEEQPGVIVSQPGSTHLYKRSGGAER